MSAKRRVDVLVDNITSLLNSQAVYGADVLSQVA